MEKKGLIILPILLVLLAFFVSAANETVEERAYACVENKIEEDKCSSLSTEEKIFSLLAVGKCKTELLADSSSKGCWPDSGCKIKTTAQAILALNKVGSSTTDAEEWLSDQNTSFDDIDWFLQVESSNKTECTAKYSGSTYSFEINEDKTLDGNAGTCLKKYEDYWFKISSSCYNEEFEISCSDSFMTSLLYKKEDSSTVYISDKTNSASGEGTTTETVSSLCFSTGSSCDYEGTLWASIVLKFLGEDVSAYIPYLISMADENSKYVPESFLYILTDNFRTELLVAQAEGKWWAESGDKFYDTAVALFPFQNEDVAEKSNSISWLEEVQGDDGCWQSNIRNTAFLLYSLWPESTALTVSNDTSIDCENSNYFCMSKSSCSQILGTVFENYSGCFGTNICCSKNKETESCSEQNGELCSADEECLGGSTVSASDTTSSKVCCIDGTCGTPTTSECEENSGTCRSSCLNDEKSSSYECSSSSKTCCIVKETSANILVIVILVILIALVIVGIIFRKKLNQFFLRFKGGKGKTTTQGPRFPPTSSSKVYPGAVPRRIIPNQNPQPIRRPVQQDKSEFDDVLKKLKEIGK